MRLTRWLLVVAGVVLPYVSRLPGGTEWLAQYAQGGVLQTLLAGVYIEGCNALAWGSLLALSFAFQRWQWFLIPCAAGFGWLAWAHGTLDLTADAQAAIALAFIPIYALLPIAVAALPAWLLDRATRPLAR